MAKGKFEEWLTEDGLIRLEGWARDGLTDEQIAHNMGINVATLYRWKNAYSKICEVLKKSKDVVDREVENALLKRAKGYTYDEITYELNKEGEMVETKRVTKEVLPDTTAQIFWLKNRKSKDWRDKKDVAVEGQVPVVITDNVQS